MKENTNKKALLLQTLRRHLVMTSKELRPFISQRITLKRMSEAGEILALGSGYYGSIELDPFVASVLAASKYYSDVVISNLTALSIYNLSDETISKVDIDIERGRSIRNRLVNAHRVPKSRLIGIVKQNFQGLEIFIYDIERSLAEAYLIDPSGPLFYKALKRYLKKKKPDIDKIQLYDKVLKTKVLNHLAQELADGK